MSTPRAAAVLIALIASPQASGAGLPPLTSQPLSGELGCTVLDGPAEGPGRSVYVAALEGGTDGMGSIVRMPLGGGPFTVVYNFDGGLSGGFPGSLVAGDDGALYGSTLAGCLNDTGGVFVLTPEGEIRVLIDFPADASSLSAMSAGADGWIYGSFSTYGGQSVIYRVKEGAPAEILYSVASTTMWSGPGPGLDGAVYYLSGPSNAGVDLMRLRPGGKPEAIYSISVRYDDWFYAYSVEQTSDGHFVFPCGRCEDEGAVYRLNPSTARLEVWSFADRPGWLAAGGLTESADGTLFGATRSTALGPLPYPLGGWPIGSGVLYQIDAAGDMQTQPLPIAPGAPMPSTGTAGRVIIGSDGRLYGTQWLGGNTYPDHPMGCGGVFWSRTPVE